MFAIDAEYHVAHTDLHNARMDQDSQELELRVRLHELMTEHRDLDEVIARLQSTPPSDELMLRRLKKRKLALKDRITLIEHMLSPDELA